MASIEMERKSATIMASTPAHVPQSPHPKGPNNKEKTKEAFELLDAVSDVRHLRSVLKEIQDILPLIMDKDCDDGGDLKRLEVQEKLQVMSQATTVIYATIRRQLAKVCKIPYLIQAYDGLKTDNFERGVLTVTAANTATPLSEFEGAPRDASTDSAPLRRLKERAGVNANQQRAATQGATMHSPKKRKTPTEDATDNDNTSDTISTSKTASKLAPTKRSRTLPTSNARSVGLEETPAEETPVEEPEKIVLPPPAEGIQYTKLEMVQIISPYSGKERRKRLIKLHESPYCRYAFITGIEKVLRAHARGKVIKETPGRPKFGPSVEHIANRARELATGEECNVEHFRVALVEARQQKARQEGLEVTPENTSVSFKTAKVYETATAMQQKVTLSKPPNNEIKTCPTIARI
eukprot:scaffold164850_cov31-Attheya_sp.AAC.2